MSLPPLPKQRDAELAVVQESHPSLLLYLTLTLIAIGMVATGFSLQTTPDWAGLLLNLGSGLVGSVVILIFVDRRLRSNELSALSRLPTLGAFRVRTALMPSRRAAYRYCESLVASLEMNLGHVIRLPEFDELERRARQGFLLRGSPGSGKTTWAQLYASDMSRRYLKAHTAGGVVVLLRLAKWKYDRSLLQTIYEHVYKASGCSSRTFKGLLSSGMVTVLLDGFDELPDFGSQVKAEHFELSEKYPKVTWILTSRALGQLPDSFGEVVEMPLPDPETSSIIRKRVFESFTT